MEDLRGDAGILDGPPLGLDFNMDDAEFRERVRAMLRNRPGNRHAAFFCDDASSQVRVTREGDDLRSRIVLKC
jgi:hypothetical protein